MKKARKYQSVSARLGLERLPKATPKTCRERAQLIEGLIRKGRVPKALVNKAQAWVYTYRTRAKYLASER